MADSHIAGLRAERIRGEGDTLPSGIAAVTAVAADIEIVTRIVRQPRKRVGGDVRHNIRSGCVGVETDRTVNDLEVGSRAREAAPVEGRLVMAEIGQNWGGRYAIHTGGENFVTGVSDGIIGVEVDGQRTRGRGDGRNMEGVAGRGLVGLQNLVGNAHAVIDDQIVVDAALGYQGAFYLHMSARLVRIENQIGIGIVGIVSCGTAFVIDDRTAGIEGVPA